MMNPDLNERYHRELASLQEWIDADEAAIASAELTVKSEQRRIKTLRRNIEKRREGWNAIYRAYLRRDLELPPHQPDLFGPDPGEAEATAGEDDPATADRAAPSAVEVASVPRDAEETAEAIEDELYAALFPAGKEPVWKQFRDAGGISDLAVAVVLSGLWPERMAFRCDSEVGPGHTVRGGKFPAFWLGDAGPAGTHELPDLKGAELADAVRRVLHLRKFVDDDQVDVDDDDEKAIKAAAARFYRPPTKADEAPVKPAKGSKRGASSAAIGAAASARP